MRRTLFVFPRDLLPAAWGSASARVAGAARGPAGQGGRGAPASRPTARPGSRRPGRPCSTSSADGRGDDRPRSARALPALEARLDLAPGKPYGANVADRAPGAHPARRRGSARPRRERRRLAGLAPALDRRWRPGWATSRQRPRPTRGTPSWWRRWLRSFGPAPRPTWSGGWARPRPPYARRSADVGAVEVSLDGGGTGWVLPDDVEPVAPVEPWAALLPVLDPTTMGWKERGFYLGAARAQLFDRNGNGGTTAWWDGRIVGCWVPGRRRRRGRGPRCWRSCRGPAAPRSGARPSG